MSRYPGGIIRKTPVTPAGPLQNGAAPGMWTLAEASFWTKQGLWPTQGNVLAVEDVFSTWLYTGNGSTQTITTGIDLAGKGGMLWIKNRSAATNNIISDTVRGAGNFLQSNASSQQFFNTDNVSALSSTGFSVGVDSNTNGTAGNLYASWTFREAPNFFDVVTYTGNSGTQNIAHSLGVAPGMILVKRTDGNISWAVYHRSQGATKQGILNTIDAFFNDSTWANTEPTSTQFTVGPTSQSNAFLGTYVAYLFAHNPASDGFIQCGSFTDAGSGANVTLGWEPQWVLVKKTDSAADWVTLDTMRGWNMTTNDRGLSPNQSADEASFSGTYGNPTATGFTVTGGNFGGNGDYIYVAIRRGPMRTPTLGTSVFTPTATSTDTATTGFPVDLIVEQPRTTSGVGAFWGDRLRGAARGLNSSNTNAETTWFTSTWSQSNTGVTNTGMGYGSSALWSFRRAPGFFDEVCYTGSNSDITIPHNLTVKPELIIVKARNNVRDWAVILPSIVTGTSSGTNFSTGSLNRTNALIRRDYGGDSWLTQDVTSTNLFFEGNAAGGNAQINFGGWTYVAYLFASAPGVSKVGTYTGNGSSQTINCAFTTGARFVLIKRTDNTGDWYVWDSARGIVAGNDPYLALNSTAAEVTTDDSVDTDNTGFVVNQVAASNINVNAATYIFLAIA
jgi:hypothetical protein